jgi:putative Mg2+ transporter-C (MgtC) family protein
VNGDFVEIALKVGLAALLAGLIGAEREWTGKAAGLRTHMLIAVGAALLTDVSIGVGDRFAAGSSTAWDPGRIAAQIVSGVGFLGAGTIIQARGGVRGLTTAAGLWVAAALGLAVGASFYVEAAVTTAVLLIILIALRPIETRLLRRNRQRVYLDLGPGHEISQLTAALEAADVDVEGLHVQETEGYRFVRLVFRGSRADREKLLARLGGQGFAVAPQQGGSGIRQPGAGGAGPSDPSA